MKTVPTLSISRRWTLAVLILIVASSFPGLKTSGHSSPNLLMLRQANGRISGHEDARG